ncbi:ABC transporter permease [Ancylobacter sp. MQZ15Z-1]|uniref:ABC transporter permease n=1 Tax=Ancylobacter mangrovi TaxID=2972472 RepID=A0A9X2PB83_9HYPH|nr:ABC transporter permease [Ancylobacter mangrovi]MCS0495524.1 ABC transporter permease [Ancylobacter mangrovi]
MTDMVFDAGNADAVLRPSLRRGGRGALWRRRLAGFVLVMPMLLFSLALFGAPLVQTLWYAVASPEVGESLPHVAAQIRRWDGEGLPPDPVYAAMAGDLVEAGKTRALFHLASRLNYELTGARRLLTRTETRLERADDPPQDARAALIAIDKEWGQPEIWQVVRRAALPVTAHYFLSAFDLRQEPDGAIVAAPAENAIFLNIMARTLWMSSVATALALLLGFPVAYLLANASARWRGLLLIPVLLPFWVSLIARLCAWIVLLQKDGIINSSLISLGVIDSPLPLLFNRLGTYIAMVHVLLPFVILPLYSVLQAIPPTYMRAASSLGASPVRAFFTAYLPQALPGLGAAASLAFIISIGFYVTQTLVGGPKEMMMSYFVAFYATQTVNWGMAAALAIILMAITLIIYVASKRIFGADGAQA